MGRSRVGVPAISCAETIPLNDPPQGKSRAVNTLACCPAAQGTEAGIARALMCVVLLAALARRKEGASSRRTCNGCWRRRQQVNSSR
ncbi:hypothetical protein EVAR_41109_1 [Eumeta japonica]|uniref:Uncharacterized protein n=1 Tax=Eumeta variegata TaxID=151549 RepID=A0A4C1XCF4_EUMVA|nr:hypothetical protein EVAR_41109_1 [Eumeta japonica]